VHAYSDAASIEETEYTKQKIQEMLYVMKNTSYCALIKDQNVSVISLADNPEYEKYLYSAKVLETFKGENLTTLKYEYVVEAHGTPDVGNDPYITCLCKNDNGYYVPDIIRFDYDASNAYLEQARNADLQNNKVLLYCDE
jgi:hypothetical protein